MKSRDFLLLALWAAGSAGAAEAPAVPLPFFGQHVFYPTSLAALPDRAFDGLRLWDSTGTQWRDVEPQPGVFDFARMDGFVQQALARHMDLIYTMGQTPRWASARPDERGNEGLGAAAEPVDMDAWSDYVRTVAKRYRGQISAYEVMNEPRIPEAIKPVSPGFFSGSTASLIEMTRRTRAVLNTADPAAKIVCPSMDGAQGGGKVGVKRLAYFLSQGGGQYCDVIGFHFYLQNWSVHDFKDMLSQVRAVMQQYGLGGKPLWDTEIGWNVSQSGNNVALRGYAMSDTDSARLMAKLMLAAMAGGVVRTYWFAHDSSSMGATLPDKRTGRLNALGIGYRSLRAWLAGSSLARNCTVADDAGDCALQRGGTTRARIVWGTPLTLGELRQRKVAALSLLDGSEHRVDSLPGSAALAELSRQFQDPVLLTYYPQG